MHDLSLRLISLACLDPAGNIRRGASAALQEMVGRHPDRISHGLKLVQIVDYYTVASRANAMLKVTSEVVRLPDRCFLDLVGGLVGWRGSASQNISDRRLAAQSIGYVSVVSWDVWDYVMIFWDAVYAQAEHEDSVQKGGLMLCLASMLQIVQEVLLASDNINVDQRVRDILLSDMMAKQDRPSEVHQPQILSQPWAHQSGVLSAEESGTVNQEAVYSLISSFGSVAAASQRLHPISVPLPTVKEVKEQMDIVQRSLSTNDQHVRKACSYALHSLLALASADVMWNVISQWLDCLKDLSGSNFNRTLGLIETLGLVSHLVLKPDSRVAGISEGSSKAILTTYTRLLRNPDTEIKCAALRSVAAGPIECNGE